MEEHELPAVPVWGQAPEVAGYQVGRLLGRGSSAAVWLGTEQATGRTVALKCFSGGSLAGGADGAAGAAGGADVVVEESVRREVRILSAVGHDHLIAVHDVVRFHGGPDGGTGLALVLDYAPGGSLAELIAARGTLGAGETVTILTPLAQVLSYLHGQGFTHSDVSPGNVLFTAQGKPLLADLGVGRMLADPADPARCGTGGFRDPAPVDAFRAGLQPEADVYSVAALGWYCLTGRTPEPEPARPPLPLLVPEVPPALAEALESGLRLDRRLRPSAAGLAAAVFRCAPAAPVDLSVSVHPTVMPELLTRRALPATARGRRAARLRAWWRTTAAVLPGIRDAAVPSAPRRAPVQGGGAGARHSVSPTAAGGMRRRRARSRPSLRQRVLPQPVRRRRPGRAAGLFLAAVLGTAGLVLFPLLGRPAETPRGFGTPAAVRALDAGEVPADVQGLLAASAPEEAVRGLAGLRGFALRTGRLALLEQVTVPDSPAAAADAIIAARLAAAGHVLDGFEAQLLQVERRPAGTPGRAEVSVTVATPAYREIDAAGGVVAGTAADGGQRLRLVLAPVEGRWRIQEILPGP